MAYRAEIEIGVKGADKLKAFQKALKETNKVLEITNKTRDIFEMPLQNVQNYTKNLKEAARALQIVEMETESETEAIKKYVQAMGESNAVRDRQNRLINEEVKSRAQARAAAIAERTGAKTQYASPIGPATKQEMDAVYASLERLQERAINQANQFTEALGRGAQEVRNIQNSLRNTEPTLFNLRSVLAGRFRAQQPAAQLALPAFRERGLQSLQSDVQNNIDASIEASRSRLRFTEKLAQEEKRLVDLGITGLRTKQLTGTATEEIAKDTAQSAQNVKDEVANQTRLNRLLRVKKGRKAQQRTRDGISNALIGGAFPLLFGQGPLAAAGGAIGGFAGGQLGGQFGFGLSLVGTQIGAVVNQVIQSASELGQALNPLTADIDKITEAAGLAGTETQDYIKAIEANAGKQAALKAATEELAAVVGAEGVEALKEFGQASTDLGNAFNKLVVQMQSGIARALAGVTQAVADALDDVAALNVGRSRTGGRFGEINKRINELQPTVELGSGQEYIDAANEINKLNRELIELVKEEEKLRKKNLARTKELQETLRGIKDQQAQVQTQLEILDITEKATTSTTEAADIRKRAAEFIARQEEQIANLRLGLERKITSIRLQNLSKEAQLRNTQDKLELARLRNRQTQASQAFAASINLQQPGRDFAISLNKAADDFKLALAKGDADRAANARTNALELERLGVQAEQTKANVRRQVAKLQADFEKKSAELNQKVTEYNKKVSENRFKLEQQLTKLQLDRIAAETALLRLKLEAENELSEKQKTYFTNITEALEKARTAVNEQAAPSQIAPIDLGSAGGVSTEAFDSVIDQARTLIERLGEAQGQLISEEVKSASIEFTGQLLEQTQALVEQRTPLDDRLETMERTAEVARLVAEGFSQADATAIVEGTQAFANLDEQLTFARENLITLLDGFLALEDKSPEIAEAIKEIQEALGKIEERLEGNKKGVDDFVNSFDKTDKIKEHIKSLEAELKDVQGMVVELAQTVESELSSAMSNAIVSVVTGTGTVQEAMSTMFTNIGKAFIDMATQMIAKALIMKALGIMFPGGGGGGGGASAVPSSAYGDMSVAGPSFFRANGGPVRPNGSYVVGEQGPELLSMGNQPGYVHRNTSEVMDRYRNGGNQGGTAANLSVNYNVTDINGMRFVTEDQFRAGMTKAAKDGAKMGEAGTFKTMKNSRSSRARVGL